MNHTLRSTLLLPLLLGPLVAQAVVSPQPFARAEGPDSIIVPLSSPFGPAMQLLQVHDDLMGTPRTLLGMRFRREGVNPWPATAGAFVNIVVRVSDAATTASTVSPIFAANHGPNLSTVRFGILPIPASTEQSLPEPFVFDVPFTQAYNYSGLAPLCWDMQVTGSTNTGYTEFDAAGGANGNPEPARRFFGTGCTLSGNTLPMSLSAGAFPDWPNNPSTITFSYGGLDFARSTTFPSPGSFALLGLGFALLDPPVALPGSACDLRIDPLVTVAIFIDANGNFFGGNYAFSLPMQPSFNGLDLTAQAFTQDPMTSAIAASDACQFHLVAPYTLVPVGSVTANGLPNQPTGTPHRNFGAIVEFY